MVPSWQYLAGFLDGEGSFTIGLSKRAHLNRRITVSLTDLETLRILCDTFGGSVCRRGPRQAGWKQVYQWNIPSSIAQQVSQGVYPYLLTKKRACEAFMRYNALPPLHKGRGRPNGWKPGQTYICECESCESTRLQRRQIAEELQEINRRGSDA